MKRLFCVLALVAGGVAAAVPQAEIDAAIARGVKYLLAQQASDGSFSDPHMPALTGLPLWALVKGGEGKGEAAKKAAQFVLGTQRSCWARSVPTAASTCRSPDAAAAGSATTIRACA